MLRHILIAAYRQCLVILVASIRWLHEREKEQKEVSDGARTERKGSKTPQMSDPMNAVVIGFWTSQIKASE